MAGQYAVLKAAIEAVIKTNGNKEITGALMQQSLLSMITSLGAYYDFVDVATPSTNPGTPDQNVMYFAATAGTYTNFGGIVVNDGEFCALCWNGQWTKKTTGAATAEQVTALGREVGYHVGVLTETFPKSTYYNFVFPITKNGKYYIVFSGEQINGNVNIRVNDGGTITEVVRDYNPSVSGNEAHFEISATTPIDIRVFFPATLAAAINGDVSVALYEDDNLRNEINEAKDDISALKAKFPGQIVLQNLIVGDFSKTTPFNFRNNLTYSISGKEVIVTNVASTGYNIWYGYPAAKKVVNHLYYFSVMMKSNTDKDEIYVAESGVGVRMIAIPDGTYHLLSVVQYQSQNADFSIRPLNTTGTGSRTTYIKSAVLIDLTACFGAGNEPTKEFIDNLLLSLPDGYLDGSIVLQDTTTLSKDVYGLKTAVSDIVIESGEVAPAAPVIVSPSMDFKQFTDALNGALSAYATLNKCSIESFFQGATYNNGGTWESIFDLVNKNLRKDIYQPGKSFKRICDEINTRFTEEIYRFKDAKVGSMLDWSLETGFQADEPSAIVSADGDTLYIYAHLKRISTQDGVTWSAAENTPLSGSVTYVMHNGVFYIDGVYYLIGCNQNTGGGLYLYTSTDGVNFTQRGKLFDAGYEFRENVPVVSWGNPYLLKEPGGSRMFLYIETQSTGESWVINLAICNDIFHDNGDGTIGDWSDTSTILKDPLNKGIVSGMGSNSAGNPDFARGIDNRPIKVNGKYYMYFHCTWKAIAHIMRASSPDLLNWTWEGVCLDVRDTPTGGDERSGNADATVIEFKGRTYMFYTWDINDPNALPYIKYIVDNRPFFELLKLRP